MKQLYLENDFAEFWIENRILIQVFKPNVTHISLEIAEKIVKDRLKVSNGIWHPIFVDLNNSRSIEKKARDYFALESSVQHLSIAALLLHSYTAWLGGKLFLTFNKPAVKTELFKSKQTALEWLQHYVDFQGPVG